VLSRPLARAARVFHVEPWGMGAWRGVVPGTGAAVLPRSWWLAPRTGRPGWSELSLGSRYQGAGGGWRGLVPDMGLQCALGLWCRTSGPWDAPAGVPGSRAFRPGRPFGRWSSRRPGLRGPRRAGGVLGWRALETRPGVRAARGPGPWTVSGAPPVPRGPASAPRLLGAALRRRPSGRPGLTARGLGAGASLVARRAELHVERSRPDVPRRVFLGSPVR
jgi:hypothetical protein